MCHLHGRRRATTLASGFDDRGDQSGHRLAELPVDVLGDLTNDTFYWLAIWSDDTNAQVYYTDTTGTVRWGQHNYGACRIPSAPAA